ncbi:MAG: hypothetical protein R6V19_08005 [Armatimonadota bacterium]
MDDRGIIEKSRVSRGVMILTVAILLVVVALIVLLPYYTNIGQVPGTQRQTAPAGEPEGPPPPETPHPNTEAPMPRE